MIHLILLRHAKSSWVNPDLSDFDRPLNKRGRRSAKALGKWLRHSEWQPEEILCSSARRTRETWEGLSIPGEPDLRPELYDASSDDMLKILRSASARTVLMIAHNPGISALAHSLVSEAPQHPRFSDFPTGALLIVGFDVKKWSKVETGSGKVCAFLTPHDLKDPQD